MVTFRNMCEVRSMPTWELLHVHTHMEASCFQHSLPCHFSSSMPRSSYNFGKDLISEVDRNLQSRFSFEVC